MLVYKKISNPSGLGGQNSIFFTELQLLHKRSGTRSKFGLFEAQISMGQTIATAIVKTIQNLDFTVQGVMFRRWKRVKSLSFCSNIDSKSSNIPI